MKSYDFSWMEKVRRPRTVTGGLSDYMKNNNSLMIEEMDYGRLFEIDLKNNNLLWRYINKENKDALPYYMKWSRRVNKLPSTMNLNLSKGCR